MRACTLEIRSNANLEKNEWIRKVRKTRMFFIFLQQWWHTTNFDRKLFGGTRRKWWRHIILPCYIHLQFTVLASSAVMKLGFSTCEISVPSSSTSLRQIGFRPKTQFQPSTALSASKDPTFTMGSETPPTTKRLICVSCSKPLRLCLCSRFKSPLLDNSISVTIIQHNQEKKHPLNSTRIAALGLKNLTVATVSDVNHEAQFLIWLLKPSSESKKAIFDRIEIPQSMQRPTFGSNLMNGCVGGDTHCEVFEDNEERLDFGEFQGYPEEKRSDFGKGDFSEVRSSTRKDNLVSDGIKDEEPVVSATIAKLEFKCTLTNLQTPENDSGILDFDKLLDTEVGKNAITNGFVVKKLHKKKLHGVKELVEIEEFEIVIPPGSALLFPSKSSVGLESVGFEVKHLIVLDGTWGKAMRMYHENPWLKLLPHLKLDPNQTSLYNEVRHEPKQGYLSTIESIVCALRKLGDDHEELDNLLDVFESMVVDQRRCKDERLGKVSEL